MTKSIFNKPIINVLLIVVLSIIAYANTFSVPFHYDDKFVIVNNPIIKDLGYFAEPSEAQKFTGWFEYTLFKYRYISYLSFALNYRFHGLNPEGYHYVNLFIHICTALLLYSFIMLTFKTPFLRNTAVKAHERHIALLAALLFACHPLQTEAVTYIWQRVASLSTLLYLLSLVMYIKFRLLSQNAGAKEPGPEQREKRSILPGLVKALFYLASLVSAVLAMKTKEIAFMLPVMLILYDLIFLKGPVRKRIIYYIPFLFTMLIIPLSLLGAESHIWDLPKDIQEQFKMETPLSTGEYLLAEFRVLVTYLRLVFLPVKQNFYYDYSRYSSFFDIEVLSSFVFLAFLLSLGLYILFRYRDSFPHVRLISYGVLWFFVNLLIESSVITLNNVIYEHRMYLPSAGVFSALSIAVFMLMVRWKAYARLITSLLVIIIVVLTGATFARNSVWKSEISLWSDVVSKSPSSLEARVNLGDAYRTAGLYRNAITEYEKVAAKTRSTSVYNNLGLAYQSAGQIENALRSYKLAAEVAPEDPQAYSNIANIHMARGETDKAIELYQYAIRLNPNISELHANLGSIYWSENLLSDAVGEYETAIKLNPDIADYHFNLADVLLAEGRINEAAKHIVRATKLREDLPRGHYKMGSVYMSQGLEQKAIEEFKMALKLFPGYFEAHNSLGILYGSMGNLPEAEKHLKAAIQINPDHPVAHNNLGNVYRFQGKLAKAREEYEAAIRLRPDYYLAYNNLGIVYGSMQRTDVAIAHLRKAIEISPDAYQAYKNLGYAYLLSGRYDEAIKEYTAAITLRPGDASLHANLGAAYKAKDMRDEALGSFLSALKLAPDSEAILLNLGRLYSEKGDFKNARRQFERVLQINPENSEVRNMLEAIREQ